MKKLFTVMAAAAFMLPAMADEPLETEGSGFLTSALNSYIESNMAAPENGSKQEEMTYGRDVKGFASAPKFGGYFIGKYSYKDQDNYPTAFDSNNKPTKWNNPTRGGGFSQRLIRLYVDGTILKDFKYRIQLQTNNDGFHMKDFFVEWAHYDFFKVKVGQFKRAFGFENPMNPWDISTGDYSLMTKYLTGHNDYLGTDADTKGSANGGRDQGIQVQGDFLKVSNNSSKDQYYLFHYQLMVSNGTGINCADNDAKKDITGTLQIQPIKNFYIGAFGWKGTYRSGGKEYDRKRAAFGAKYENKGWSARAEYAYGRTNNSSKGNADAWYVVGGMPVNDWFKLSAQYQTARISRSWNSAQCIYSLIPEFQLHKNLKVQIQYNYNDVRTSLDRHFNELWVETYVRF
ncbi:MAG: porin [Bacteroidales bacterium]|nr:porin [Candidatus Liminaster caballi]